MKNSLLSIIESTHDSIILINKKGEIILWNKASCKIFGYSQEEAVGESIHIIMPSEFHKMHDKGMSNFLLSGEKKIIDSTVELTAQKKNGLQFPIELSLSSWEENDNIYICGIIRDISQRKSQEKNIMDLSDIIDSSPCCLTLINKDGSLLKMNQVGLNLIEANSFEAVNKTNMYDLVKEEDRAAYIAFNKRVCSGKEDSLIFTMKGLQGSERSMETFARPHTLENGENAQLAITNDITLRTNAEKELLLKDQALEEAKRLSVLGEFAAGIAHEINNPLSVIYAKSQLLEIQLNNAYHISDEEIQPIKHSINSIIDTIKQTSEIINNLKTFSASADFDNLDYHELNGIVDMALKLSEKRCINAGVQLHVSIDPKIKLLCSSTGLSQVILNLIHNSFDAIENLDNKWIKIESSVTKQSLRIIITDSGNGIDTALAGKILQPFFTTKDPAKGTGLGLSISLNAIHKMKGKLYYNEKAKNTQFIIEFKSFRQ